MFFAHRQRRDRAMALVTGATSGIGAAFARTLPASTGLVLNGRDKTALEDLRASLRGEGRQVEIVVGDLADQGELEVVAEAADALAIDLLINNAGIGQLGPFLEDRFDAEPDLAADTRPPPESTIAVNVTAPVSLARRLLPGMVERAAASGQRAGLINVASTAAFVPIPNFALYAASKAFLLSFTESLAVELGDAPIDVAALCPGPVRTPFAGKAGYSGRTFPGTQEPDTVARIALEQLGRHRVIFTDPASQAALTPVTLARAAVARSLHFGRMLNERMEGSRGRPPAA